MSQFSNLRAVFLNCSLKAMNNTSHTQKLMERSIHIMRTEGINVESIHMRNYNVMFGMTMDASTNTEKDDWPDIQKKIIAADILVIGSPIWLGIQSSVASLAIERMYSYSSEVNEKGQYVYYGKVGGCLVTGNEDGVKHVARDILYSLQHIGFTIPPQADAGWIGEIGPGPSYGDKLPEAAVDSSGIGYASEFTNKNTTYMTWNLMHLAKLLKDNGGIPAKGNNSDWKSVNNATDISPATIG